MFYERMMHMIKKVITVPYDLYQWARDRKINISKVLRDGISSGKYNGRKTEYRKVTLTITENEADANVCYSEVVRYELERLRVMEEKSTSCSNPITGHSVAYPIDLDGDIIIINNKKYIVHILNGIITPL